MRTDDSRKVSSHGPDRRRGRRIPLTFDVEVSGMTETGVPYRDAALASDVSERGCKLHLVREVKSGDLLTIRVLRKKTTRDQTDPPFLYQVAWVVGGEHGWMAGLASLESGNPWGMNFPLEEKVIPE
jgi:hypothetical protein